MIHRAHPLFFALVLMGVVWGSDSFAQEDLSPSTEDLEELEAQNNVVYRVVFLPHTTNLKAMETVYQALELDLALNENLIMVPTEDFLQELGEEKDLPRPALLQDLTSSRRIDVVIRSRSSLNGPILQIHRASDGGIVFAKLLKTPLSQKQTADLYREIYLAIAELEDLPTLSTAALAVLEHETAPPAQEKKPPLAPAPTEPGETHTPASVKETQTPPEEDAPRAALDRLGRFTLSYSPVFASYQACEPELGSLPFTCQAKEESFASGATIFPWSGFAGASTAVELYPWIPYFGFFIDGSLFQSQLAFSKDLYNVPSINVLGGHLQLAAMGRGVFSLSVLRIGVGIRLGYQLLFTIVDEHFIPDGENAYDVTLFPSTLVHSSVVGVALTTQLLKFLRFHLDVDILPAALAIETPTTIGAAPLSVGVSSQAKIDLDVLWGFILSASLKGTVINTDTTGAGTRLTRELDSFHSGRSVLMYSTMGIGLGYHF